MKMKRVSTFAAMGALCSVSGIAAAVPITDPTGDFLPSYVASGRPTGADLDVISSEVIYHPGSQKFEFIGTLAGAIGTTPPASNGETPLYVWGVDRGAGTERFLAGTPSIGDGVAFDSVVILNPNGAAIVNLFGLGGSATTLLGAALISGNTISTLLDASLFPSQGSAFGDYTWNFWPRFGGGNNAQISDFFPNEADGANNAANARVTIPEPSTLALLSIGALAFMRRRLAR